MWKIQSERRPPDIADEAIQLLPSLEDPGLALARTLHNAIIKNEGARNLADALHGSKWLGHPLHPVLTDVTLGAWMMAFVFDLLSVLTLGRWKGSRNTADTLTTLGTMTAIPTALTGITDYSAIKQNAARHGALHGLLNTVILGLYVLSVRARRGGYWFSGALYSAGAMGLSLVSAWIGGELVYRWRVGVNHTQPAKTPTEWTAVLPETELVEAQTQLVDFDGQRILLYRKYGTVYAIGAVCSHAGGPLEEGQVYNDCVQCPWHDSVYDLRDGSVVHGPATYNQPTYHTRIQNGQIEIYGAQEQ